MDFEAYLISKRIDSPSFQKAEPMVWEQWKTEFDQLHPKSFTAQRLYQINPIRRKYHLKQVPVVEQDKSVAPEKSSVASDPVAPVAKPKPVVPRPMFKPKPKTD